MLASFLIGLVAGQRAMPRCPFSLERHGEEICQPALLLSVSWRTR